MADKPISADYPMPGVRVEVFDETSPIRLCVRTSKEMTDWTPFVSDTTREESKRVATSIEYRDVLYAIAKCRHLPSGWQYDMIPWPSGEIPRRIIRLSREFWQHIQTEKQIERRRDRIARGLGFLIAFLPASVQNRVSEEYDYDATAWTRINSIATGFVAASFTLFNNVIMAIAAGYGKSGSPAMDLLYWLMPYLLLDSFVRLGTTVAGQQPMGLLPFEFVDWMVRSNLRRGKARKPTEGAGANFSAALAEVKERPRERIAPSSKRAAAAPKADITTAFGEPLSVDDSIPGFRVLAFAPENTHPFIVETSEQMADWVCYNRDPLASPGPGATTILYRGAHYAIAASEPVASGWAYALVLWPEGEMARKVFELSPEAAARREQKRIELEKEKQRDRIANVLGVLIPFLPASIQERISETYDYNAPRWAFINSAGMLGISLTIIIADAATTRGVMGLVGGCLMLDSGFRLACAMLGQAYGLVPGEILYWMTRTIVQAARRLAGKTSGSDLT